MDICSVRDVAYVWPTLIVEQEFESLGRGKALYRKYYCRVTHNGLLSEDIPVNAGIRQECLLSPILFLVVLHGIMQKVTKSKRRGIEWGLSSTLEDLDYADDLCLLSHTHTDMQAKLDDLRREAIEMGLKINTRKTQEMRCRATTSLPLLHTPTQEA
nr:uncharacterized protein LOC116769294 [Danaus plexippus plexippus]